MKLTRTIRKGQVMLLDLYEGRYGISIQWDENNGGGLAESLYVCSDDFEAFLDDIEGADCEAIREELRELQELIARKLAYIKGAVMLLQGEVLEDTDLDYQIERGGGCMV